MTAAYIAAPLSKYLDADEVAQRLRAEGYICAPRWLAVARSLGGQETGGPVEAAVAIEQNDADVRHSDFVVALAYPSLGREMWCETRYAQTLAIPVYWVIPPEVAPPLSAWRRGSVVVASVDAALAAIRQRHRVGGRA